MRRNRFWRSWPPRSSEWKDDMKDDRKDDRKIQTEAIHAKAVEDLRARLRGALLRSGEEGYEEARAAWNLNARQSPAVVVMAKCADDVLAAVRFARDLELGVGVMATGHGVGAPSDGGLYS